MSSDGFVTKEIARAEFTEAGEVEAVVATLGAVDRDRDVFLPGAFPPRSRVWLSSYGHDVVRRDAPPAGVGFVTPDRDRAVLRGRFFIDTDRGREAFRVVKNLGEDGEWSIGYSERSVRTAPLTHEWRRRGARRLVAAVEPLEASPVFMAAGFDTGTVAAKDRRDQRSIDEKLACEVQATLKRAERLVGLPPPERFKPFVRWALARYAMSPSEAPPILLVAGSKLDHYGPGIMGLYHKSGAVLVRAGLEDDEVRATVFHELAHVYEEREGWLHSERFAYAQEARLMERWNRERVS